MAKRKEDSALPLNEVRQLIDLLLARGLAELEVSRGETHVAATAAPLLPSVAPSAPEQAERAEAHLVTVEAPMVGTFYRAPSPSADPYVREGDVIKEGQVLCIIEAMKLMNEIESKVAGRISKILVENGQPVEYGQPLFRIEPRA
jgi:acetyl-CoA carboxylase biotin carboxyl carrier protein